MDPVTLQNLLDALTSGDDLSGLLAQCAGLGEAETQAVEAADALRTERAGVYSEDDIAALDALVRVAEAIRAEGDRRATLSAEADAKVEALAKRLHPAAEPEPEPIVEPEPEPEPVTAAAPKTRVDLAAIARRAPRPTPPAKAGLAAVLTAAADVPGVPTGVGYAAWSDVAQATSRRWNAMNGQGEAYAGVAVLKRPELELVATNAPSDYEVVQKAGDERRLAGNSLLAAGGWCAPSETLYDLCDVGMSVDGILDLPEIRATRGGIRWTTGPDFCDIFTQSAFWTMTEAQVEASVPKPCFEIPCPDFVECRLSPLGFCLQGGLLNARAYPEMIEDWLRKTVVAFAHYRNAYVINQLVAGSTDLGTLGTCGAGIGGGATGSILGAIDLQATAYRERNRLAVGTTLELVAPHWVTGVIRADLAQRTGVDLVNVSDATVAAYFAARGVRLDYVYDWQPLTACLGPGAPDAMAWNDSVTFLLYAAGTWVQATSDIITLDARYDSSLTVTNRYGIRFQEEGICVLKRCTDSRMFSVDICPTGITTAPQAPCVCGS